MYFLYKTRVFVPSSMEADEEMEGIEKQIVFLLV